MIACSHYAIHEGEFLNEARSLCDVHELAPRGLHQFVPNLAQVIRGQKPTHVITAFVDVAVLTWMDNGVRRVGWDKPFVPVNMHDLRLSGQQVIAAMHEAEALLAVA